MPPSVVRFVRELRMGCVSSAGDSVPHEQRGVESELSAGGLDRLTIKIKTRSPKAHGQLGCKHSSIPSLLTAESQGLPLRRLPSLREPQRVVVGIIHIELARPPTLV